MNQCLLNSYPRHCQAFVRLFSSCYLHRPAILHHESLSHFCHLEVEDEVHILIFCREDSIFLTLGNTLILRIHRLLPDIPSNTPHMSLFVEMADFYCLY